MALYGWMTERKTLDLLTGHLCGHFEMCQTYSKYQGN